MGGSCLSCPHSGIVIPCELEHADSLAIIHHLVYQGHVLTLPSLLKCLQPKLCTPFLVLPALQARYHLYSFFLDFFENFFVACQPWCPRWGRKFQVGTHILFV
jgi:hypothetical protein